MSVNSGAFLCIVCDTYVSPALSPDLTLHSFPSLRVRSGTRLARTKLCPQAHTPSIDLLCCTPKKVWGPGRRLFCTLMANLSHDLLTCFLLFGTGSNL